MDAMKDVGWDARARHQIAASGKEQVVVTVSDTGVGLPAQQGDQIFKASLPPNLTARVMGLSISRSIVESHGGRLWAADNSPRGASFISPYPPKPRHTIEDRDPVARIAALLTVSASLTGGERNNGNENSEVGRPGNSWSLH